MVVDASVVVSRLVPHDVHHEASRRWLTRHVTEGGLVIAPARSCPRCPRRRVTRCRGEYGKRGLRIQAAVREAAVITSGGG